MISDLRHVEQRGDARHDVLAEGGGRGEHVAVAGGQSDTPARPGSRPAGRRRRRVGDQHLGDAGDLGGGLGGAGAAAAGDQHVHVAADLARRRRC
jgi:hypothetical protein